MKKVISLMIMLSFFISLPVSAEEKRDLHDEIIYDILIDRFNIGNLTLSENVHQDNPLAYQGGDLIGITKKLDRIKDLGFTAIILSPLMENAENGYHGYWIEDFFEVESEFGTFEDLNNLVEEAHQRGIKVIMEFVTNYVATSHPFVTDSNKEEWFKTYTDSTDAATEWKNHVVVLDQDNPEVESYLIEVADFWMEKTNIDGFKLNDADLSSVSFLTAFTEHIHKLDSEFYVLAGVSSSGQSKMELSEIEFIDAIENNAMFEELNHVFTEADRPVSSLYDTWIESGNQSDILFVDNQDTARFSNNFAEKGRNALTTWKLALAYMYTTPGVPVIFQGSELPMYGPSFIESQMLVQFNSTNPDIEEYYDRISSLRKEFKPLTHGDFELIGSNEGMSVFKRTYEEESIYIAINNDSSDRSVKITDVPAEKQLHGILGDSLVRGNNEGEFTVSVARESAEVFLIEEESGLNWLFIGFIVGVFVLFIGFIFLLTRQQRKQKS